MDDDSTLNIGVIFSENPDLNLYRIFEHRYWFRLDDDKLTVLRQGTGWYNEQAPDGLWVETNVSHVIERLQPPTDVKND